MKFVVHDASILIDLALSKTVEAWFATGVETWTTNLIYPYEIGKPEQRALFEAYVAAKKLRIKNLTPSELEEVVRERERLSRGLSLADVSALNLTKSLGADAVLATGDRLLRTTAEKAKVTACVRVLLSSCSERRVSPPRVPVLAGVRKSPDRKTARRRTR